MTPEVKCAGCDQPIAEGETAHAIQEGSIQNGEFVREDMVSQVFHPECLWGSN